MRKSLVLLIALLSLPFAASASIPSEAYTPGQLGCGSAACALGDWWMPYKFRMYDGGWSGQLILPAGTWGISIDIASNAAYTSSIRSESGGNIYLRFPFGNLNVNTDIKIYRGDRYIFNAGGPGGGAAWMPVGDSVRYMQPSRDGVIASNEARMVVFQLADKNWTSDIYFPDKPLNDQIIVIHSEAGWSSQVHGSTSGSVLARISRGETLIYKYSSGSWKSISWRYLGNT